MAPIRVFASRRSPESANKLSSVLAYMTHMRQKLAVNMQFKCASILDSSAMSVRPFFVLSSSGDENDHLQQSRRMHRPVMAANSRTAQNDLNNASLASFSDRSARVNAATSMSQKNRDPPTANDQVLPSPESQM